MQHHAVQGWARQEVSPARAEGGCTGARAENPGAWGRMGPHGAAWGLAWGRTGPHGAAWMGLGMDGAGCYLLRWCWANNPLTQPSKYPIPADLSITGPTCLIGERDGAPLGAERHEALARR
jgi:hypothetical protein